jgi:PAS domain-containing protein
VNADRHKGAMAPKSEAASDRPLDSERQASQNRRELLESLFAHVADAIFLIGASGDIIDVNPAACVILGSQGGAPRDASVGSCSECIQGGDR